MDKNIDHLNFYFLDFFVKFSIYGHLSQRLCINFRNSYKTKINNRSDKIKLIGKNLIKKMYIDLLMLQVIN